MFNRVERRGEVNNENNKCTLFFRRETDEINREEKELLIT